MLDRRQILKGAALIGCSAAAHPLLSTVTFAAAPGENRLCVIILRGAMDGLDLCRPVADPLLAAYRPGLAAARDPATELGNGWALHPALAPLMPLWAQGQLGVVQATSTPYRDKRSHFDGQDILEAGTGGDLPPASQRDGWLNRMLQAMPGLGSETAFSVGAEGMLILSGAARVASWSPDTKLALSPQAQLLLESLYHDDPLFRDAGAAAMALAGEIGADPTAAGPGGNGANLRLARFAAERLAGETRIAAFSIAGWDTHRAQTGVMRGNLARLAQVILALRDGLGPVWARTTVLAMTEFGRTARENGTGGTDHGTGGAMLVAGGAVKGGRVMGRWPGLDEAALYDRRDILPTSDVRAWAGWAMRGLYGFDRALVEGTVFPGLDLGENPGLLL
ncbi:DUF1501 domain-containing protein [Frigidibacter sp. MR17.14]|uniref:DUF1501 domain-containing protein n=1 Tax=Frigidibacter sp. MR17.14 TaxID=3126509 RepID=UPI003012FE84